MFMKTQIPGPKGSTRRAAIDERAALMSTTQTLFTGPNTRRLPEVLPPLERDKTIVTKSSRTDLPDATYAGKRPPGVKRDETFIIPKRKPVLPGIFRNPEEREKGARKEATKKSNSKSRNSDNLNPYVALPPIGMAGASS